MWMGTTSSTKLSFGVPNSGTLAFLRNKQWMQTYGSGRLLCLPVTFQALDAQVQIDPYYYGFMVRLDRKSWMVHGSP